MDIKRGEQGTWKEFFELFLEEEFQIGMVAGVMLTGIILMLVTGI